MKVIQFLGPRKVLRHRDPGDTHPRTGPHVSAHVESLVQVLALLPEEM